ncbi:MAG: hydantoinase/oxoprolinase family protein [Alphaproteobacteria bacterium]|nr:hydantoinase/oxoprolinase family protein [Alphaproteobacteria bacterium]
MISIGVDVGGTFTDCIAVADGQVATAKVVSTPANPALAVLEGVRGLLKSLNRPPTDLARFLHGTTVAINAALQRKGARIGFITTKGFEDALEIGRMSRSDAFDVNAGVETLVFLAPRRVRIGVDERLDAQGAVVTALDEDQVRAAAKLLVETHGAEIIAIGLLFSFLNPAQEKRARDLIVATFPKLEVIISSDIDPGFREYERFTTTLFDTYLRPVVSRYVTDLAGRVAAESKACTVMMMKSSGGLCAPARAAAQPLHLLKSGLAGGVQGACAVAARAGFPDIISIDIGGTSCDVALVRGGAPVIKAESRLDTYPIRAGPDGVGGRTPSRCRSIPRRSIRCRRSAASRA